MYVLGRDIHALEQVLLHEAVIALQLQRLHGVIFVEVEGHDVSKRKSLLLMQPHKLAVDADRRRARRQAKHTSLTAGRLLANECGDLTRDHRVDFARLGEHAGGNALAGGHCSGDGHFANLLDTCDYY